MLPTSLLFSLFGTFKMFSGTSSLVVTGGNFTFNEPRNATQGESPHLGYDARY